MHKIENENGYNFFNFIFGLELINYKFQGRQGIDSVF